MVRFVTGSTAVGATSASGSRTNRRVVQSRMRDGQLRRIDDPVAEEQQVEVQGPLAPVDRPYSAEPGFDLLEDVEQGERVERRLEHGGGVEKHPLARRAADGLGLMERADASDDTRPASSSRAAIAPFSVASRSPRLLPRPISASDGHAHDSRTGLSELELADPLDGLEQPRAFRRSRRRGCSRRRCGRSRCPAW